MHSIERKKSHVLLNESKTLILNPTARNNERSLTTMKLYDYFVFNAEKRNDNIFFKENYEHEGNKKI